jgi:serine/threonine-protein kinase RsbW
MEFPEEIWRQLVHLGIRKAMDFSSDIEHLSKMLNFICDNARTAGIKGERLYKLELASEEALVNVISYAFPAKEPGNYISISCQKVEDKRFEVIILDKGIPFNPIDTSKDIDIHKSIEERRVGGLGIFLIHKLLDEVSYRRIGNENVLKLVMLL